MRHPLAFIHPEAKIAENVIVDPFATIEKDVVIGEGTHIYSHAVVMDGARIGKNCRIFPGAVIAGIPQDLKFHGEESVAIIGDNTTRVKRRDKSWKQHIDHGIHSRWSRQCCW